MRTRTSHFFVLASIAVVLCAVLPQAVSAQVIKLEVGVGATSQVTEPYLANYIVQAYQFITGSIGIVAAVMIMFNGMRWVTAGGNSENVSTARDGIISAVVGLLIALMSYVLLNAINPALVGFQDLDQAELEFVEPTTTSPEALASGQISDDPNLVWYTSKLPSDLQAYMQNSADQPYITQATFTALQAALTSLRDNPEYQGMKLVIASANRSMSTQWRLWNCYQSKKNSGVCPSTGCGSCNQAASPGTSNHGYGTALDVSWKNTGSGKYTTTTGYASSSWHKSCMVKNSGSDCTTNLRNSVIALNTMMQSAGFGRICIEWWHHQIGGTKLCSPGTYQ